MAMISYTTFDLIVYVEWEYRVNFVTIFGDLYQNKLWGICNNLNQFTHLSSESGRMMTSSKWPLKCYLCTYIHKSLDSKH